MKQTELAFLVEDYVCFKRHDPEHVFTYLIFYLY